MSLSATPEAFAPSDWPGLDGVRRVPVRAVGLGRPRFGLPEAVRVDDVDSDDDFEPDRAYGSGAAGLRAKLGGEWYGVARRRLARFPRGSDYGVARRTTTRVVCVYLYDLLSFLCALLRVVLIVFYTHVARVRCNL